jgi:hypothetical protein
MRIDSFLFSARDPSFQDASCYIHDRSADEEKEEGLIMSQRAFVPSNASFGASFGKLVLQMLVFAA